MLVHQGVGRVAGEGKLAEHHLVEHDAQRVDVRADVHQFAAPLLGGHVGRGAQDAARGGELGRPGEHLGDAEVGQVGVVALVEQHVVRLQVAVDDALFVGEGQRTGDLAEHPRRQRQRQRPARQAVVQAATAYGLHDDVDVLAFAPEVNDRQDVRVLQAGDELRLVLEAGDELLVVGQLSRHHLDGHVAVHRSLAGQVDGGHPSPAQHRPNRVLAPP